MAVLSSPLHLLFSYLFLDPALQRRGIDSDSGVSSEGRGEKGSLVVVRAGSRNGNGSIGVDDHCIAFFSFFHLHSRLSSTSLGLFHFFESGWLDTG